MFSAFADLFASALVEMFPIRQFVSHRNHLLFVVIPYKIQNFLTMKIKSLIKCFLYTLQQFLSSAASPLFISTRRFY